LLPAAPRGGDWIRESGKEKNGSSNERMQLRHLCHFGFAFTVFFARISFASELLFEILRCRLQNCRRHRTEGGRSVMHCANCYLLLCLLGDEAVNGWYSEISRVNFKNVESGQHKFYFRLFLEHVRNFLTYFILTISCPNINALTLLVGARMGGHLA